MSEIKKLVSQLKEIEDRDEIIFNELCKTGDDIKVKQEELRQLIEKLKDLREEHETNKIELKEINDKMKDIITKNK
jgi:hypothetical protein